MAEIADIEINAPFVRLGSVADEGSIDLDQDTARALYGLAWSKFEKALGNTNSLYSEEPSAQAWHFNRAKRLLWEITDLKQAVEVIYSMTVIPEDDPVRTKVRPDPVVSPADTRGYVGPVAHEITFDAQREPMFQDEHGSGWVPLATYNERCDELAALLAVGERDKAEIEGLKQRLDSCKRWHDD